MTLPKLDIIIRTMASAERGRSLMRAINSLVHQGGMEVHPIVVVNGGRRDPAVMRALRLRTDSRLIEIDGGLEDALRAGRRAVSAPWFGFLDDDDLFLPDAAATLAPVLLAEEATDLVVANGLLPGNLPLMDDVAAVRANPIKALTESAWLVSCAGSFRTTAFPLEWFADLPPLFEWTWIAYKAALEKRLCFVEAPCWRVNDTPGSTSKSDSMLLFQLDLVDRLLSLDLSEADRAQVRRRRSRFLHSLSDEFRRRGDRLPALRYHLRSILAPGGWRYLPYSRRLLQW
jgi:glycosyltransferase involved in cell wall biosynthesis